MGVEAYIELRANRAVRKASINESDTEDSKDETQSDREWLLAAMLSIAIAADKALAAGKSPKEVSSALKSDWMEALKKAAVSAFKKGVAVRASEVPNRPSEVARESERLRAQLEEQSNFLSGFADDYVGGVTTEPRRMPFMNRAQLYALSMIGYYNLGALAGGNPNDQIYWRLGACDHCTDCPALHVSGPYTPQTLPTVPGLGHTKCGHWCCCFLYIVPSALRAALDISLGGGAAMAAAIDAGGDIASRILDARLRAAYASRAAIDTDNDEQAQRAAEAQAELDSIVAGSEVEFSETFPLGGPIVGMAESGIVVPDLLYNRGIDSESLRSVSESDIDEFLRGQFDRGAQ